MMLCIRPYLLYIIFELTIIHSNQFQNEVEVKHRCYMPKLDSGNDFEKCNGPPIAVNFENDVNNNAVIAEFELAPPWCMLSGYDIDIIVSKTEQNNDSCSQSSNFTHHSLRRYHIIECLNSSCPDACGKYGKVTLFNMVSGCYKAVIHQLIIPMGRQARKTSWKYIKTNYTGSWEMIITSYKKLYYPESQVMDINLKFSKPTSKMMLQLIKNDDFGTILQELVIFTNSHSNECDLQKNEAVRGGKNVFVGISCKLQNITPDEYTLKVHIFNYEQCDEEMNSHFINEICWKEQDLVANAPLDQETITMSNNWVLITMIVVFSSLLIIFGLILWIRWRKRIIIPLSNDDTKRPLFPSFNNNNFEILLLYARDCEQFMNTMKSFKELLQDVSQLKVHDCFDHLNWEKEFMSPQDWLEKIMKYKQHLHIVIVPNYCSHIQQKMFLSGAWNFNIPFFKQPSYTDNLFMYGVKHLKDIQIYNVADRKIFVIELIGFSDGVNLNSLPTMPTVYKLPLHFSELFRDMAIGHFQEDLEEMDKLKKCKMYRIFVNQLDILKKFRIGNQNYLKEILNSAEQC